MKDVESFSTTPPEVIPYDTGKVKIGSKFTPQVFTMSEEEMEIQGIILGDHDNIAVKFARFLYEWALVISGAVLVLYIMVKV